MHKTANVLNKLPKSQQPKARRALQDIWMAETKADAETAFDGFIESYEVKYDKAAECLRKDRDTLLAFYDFPAEHWKHLRTSNVVESPFSRVRLRTTASRRFKSQVNATCLIWKTLMVAEMSFRKLNAPNLVEKVAEGKKYESGKEIRVAA